MAKFEFNKMEKQIDFEKQIDWDIYEKVEKALPSLITDNKYLLKGYIVKDKKKDTYLLIRFFKISSTTIKDLNEIAEVLTCPDFDEVSGFLPFRNIEQFTFDNDTYIEVINPFPDYISLMEVDNLSDIQKHKIIIKLVHSMSALHDHGIIYETFNPKKILVTNNYEPLIFDYGLDQLIVIDNQFTESIDPIYFSPEVLTKLKNDKSQVVNITTKTDVFSFGVILYEFLAGKKMEKSLVIPLDFRDQIYIWIISSSINQNCHQRPTFTKIEQYLLNVLPLKENQDLNNYIKTSKIFKEEHFELKEKSTLKTVFKFTIIFIILEKLFEFNLSYFLLFLIDILIIIFSHPNIQLILGAYLIKRDFLNKLSIKLVTNAAHLSYPDALMYLANLYEIGKVVEKSKPMAYCLYKLAYQKGKKAALNGIFQSIGTGNGTVLNSVRSELLLYKLTGIRYIDPTNYFNRISCQIRSYLNIYRN